MQILDLVRQLVRWSFTRNDLIKAWQESSLQCQHNWWRCFQTCDVTIIQFVYDEHSVAMIYVSLHFVLIAMVLMSLLAFNTIFIGQTKLLVGFTWRQKNNRSLFFSANWKLFFSPCHEFNEHFGFAQIRGRISMI